VEAVDEGLQITTAPAAATSAMSGAGTLRVSLGTPMSSASVKPATAISQPEMVPRASHMSRQPSK